MQAQTHEAEEVFNVVFPLSDEAAEVVHPGEEPFYFPAVSISAQLSPVLSSRFAPALVGRDHLDAVFVPELLVGRVRVVGLVSDEPGQELVEKAFGQNVFHKLALGRRSAVDRYGERKTVIAATAMILMCLCRGG